MCLCLESPTVVGIGLFWIAQAESAFLNTQARGKSTEALSKQSNYPEEKNWMGGDNHVLKTFEFIIKMLAFLFFIFCL